MPDIYGFKQAREFNREKLRTAFPNRLDELAATMCSLRDRADKWYVDLIIKLLQNVKRTCRDLLGTMEQEALTAAAWNARNLLELSIWVKYCAVSRENALRFHADTLRDMEGLVTAISKLHALRQIPDKFEDSSHKKIAELARDELGLDSLDGSYERVGNAAKSIGQYDWFVANNTVLSKFAHPTAGLVIGIMHQTEIARNLQDLMITNGAYSAELCVTALGEIALAVPAV